MNEITTQRTPEIIAVEINSIKDQARRMVLSASIEIGRRLVEAKTILPHGEWGEWLERSVDYSQRTAQNLMRIFDEYGANQLGFFGENVKSQALADLNYTQAVALLGVAVDEREQFLEEHDINQMSTRELQQAIKERSEALIQAEQFRQLSDKKTEEARKLLEEKEEILEGNNTLIFERDEILEKIRLLTEDNRKLEEQISEAQTAGDDDETEVLRESIKEAEKDLSEQAKKIQELERQLSEKPIETVAAQVIERVPEEVETELQELRKKAAQPGDEVKAKFKVYFELLTGDFKLLLNVLAEISDIEEHDRYKKALSGLLDKMSEKL